jgi:hypothetical protein
VVTVTATKPCVVSMLILSPATGVSAHGVTLFCAGHEERSTALPARIPVARALVLPGLGSACDVCDAAGPQPVLSMMRPRTRSTARYRGTVWVWNASVILLPPVRWA